MTNIQKIKSLTEELLQYCHEYYVLDKPSISDIEFDKKFDELKRLEDESNFWLANSPTRKVQGTVLDGFEKVKHSKPMLSAVKTKDVSEIQKFLGDNEFYCSFKLDGLTLCISYENGYFKRAVTRGDGINGEDVTEQAKMIQNLPMKISYKGFLELRGECVVSWKNFYKINETLEEPYSHPRNLAAGGLRNLDTNITKQRNLSYVVFECVSDLYNKDTTIISKWDELELLDSFGFETVDRIRENVHHCVSDMVPEAYKYPVDGLIFEIDNKEYSKSLGATAHHESCRMALKWQDSTYKTILRDVIWDVGRSGIISPVAVFDDIDLDGAMTSKATLHNLSVIENLQLGIGDTITVYRSNQVIPKVDENLTRSNTLVLPQTCPSCGCNTKIRHTDNSKFLTCPNPDCKAKLLATLVHFTSRNCMNIEGLSEATLEKFIDKGWLKDFTDIYKLYQHKDEIITMDGFGERSYQKIWDAIEKSRNTSLERVITAIGIPNIGKSASKEIAKLCDGNVFIFVNLIAQKYDFTKLKDFGQVMSDSIYEYFYEMNDKYKFLTLTQYLRFDDLILMQPHKDNPFVNKTVVVTGSLQHYTRDGIVKELEHLGAHVVGSVSKKTDFLITGEKAGSKLDKAKTLGVKVLSEDEVIKMKEVL